VSNIQNRPVVDSHVQALANNFTTIRRCQPQDQLDVAMTKEQFEHCLVYTVAQMKAKGCTRECYRNVDALRAATDPTKLYIDFKLMPILCWDLKLGALPSLKTGQHRRLGIIVKNEIPLPYQPSHEIDETNKLVSWPSAPLIGRSI
jgi:hypothetical protein